MINIFDLFNKEQLEHCFNVPFTNESIFGNRNDYNPILNNDKSVINEDIVTATVPEFNNLDLAQAALKDTYSNYQPKKMKLGQLHSYNVVESRSLSSVEAPDVTYKLNLPQITVEKHLSSVQLEAIVYACQKHETFLSDGYRSGFLIGDGAGVGKGRTVAGIIYENILAGRKRSVWVSISADLIEDAKRDFRDIGASITVTSLNTLSYKEKGYVTSSKDINECLYVTYASLVGHSNEDKRNAFNSRYDQIVAWFGKDYDGVIIFDECHKAKNIKDSKTAVNVIKLQNDLKNARIIYSSATGASEVSNMAYMVRLGIWGIGKLCTTFDIFEKKLKRHGVSSMELVAINMKQRGVYIARQLSFHNIKFDIIEVVMEEEKINGHCFKYVYNKCVNIWINIYIKFQEAYIKNSVVPKFKSHFEAMYWASHQNFFKYLCISGKVNSCVKITLEEIKKGNCVVIGLQSTGENKTNSALSKNNGEVTDYVSSAKEIIKDVILKHFPSKKNINKLTNKKKTSDLSNGSNESKDGDFNDDELIEDQENYDALAADHLKDIKEIESIFPHNTLDQLITELGGPKNVAELTGRKGRITKKANGNIVYEQRKSLNVPMNKMNMDEKNKFNEGSKLIAIISDAASTGISLHSDQRFKNKRQRVHITLELPWSADKAIQQFGRTHRSNQFIPPHYKFIISDLAGERRFAATVAKRLETLGALTHGDRRAGDSKDLSQFNFENDIGFKSVQRILSSIIINATNSVSFPEDYVKKYAIDNSQFRILAKDALRKVGIVEFKECSVAKFLNRLLGIEVDMQNALFEYFIDTVESIIKEAKFQEEFDHGIRDITSHRIECEKIKEFRNLSIDNGGKVIVSKMKSFSIGMPWEHALKVYNDDQEKHYFSLMKTPQFDLIALNIPEDGNVLKLLTPMFPEQLFKNKTDMSNWVKIDLKTAETVWSRLYEGSEEKCLHSLKADCMKRNCYYGKRTKIDYMITGEILTARDFIDQNARKKKLNVARVELKDQGNVIGAFFSPFHYDSIMQILKTKYAQDVFNFPTSNDEIICLSD